MESRWTALKDQGGKKIEQKKRRSTSAFKAGKKLPGRSPPKKRLYRADWWGRGVKQWKSVSWVK